MAPPPLQNISTTLASTSQQNNTSSNENPWPCRTWGRLRSRLKSNNMQGMAPKILFMTGFLINCAAMSGLFILLSHEWEDYDNRATNTCLPIPELYDQSINISCTFFVLVSIFLFVIMCLMQCRRYNIDKNAYKMTAVLATATFLWSILLMLISSTAIITQNDKNCVPINSVLTLKLRYVFQSTASLITSSIYMIVGISLVKRRRVAVNPIPPPTPIYQISPPEFDSLFPPPPTYQQSQIQHQRRTQ